MHYLQEIDASSPVSVGAFRSALDDGDQTVRLTATASLLHGDQIDVLPIAEAALLRPDDSDWVTNMRVAIRDKVRIDRSTLPVLERLFAGGDVETRRAIARAVRRGHSAVALKILRVALDDRDIDVKYNAVMSLAHIAGQPEHGISRIAFSANPHKYTEYWKEWLRNRSHVWRLGNHEEDAAVTVNGVPPSDSGVHVVSVIGEPA